MSPSPPWLQALEKAMLANKDRPEARFCQLATLDAHGHPANRTVVFRGFWDADGTLMIVSDTRSPKVTQIHHHPWGAVCWYFPISREQFRLKGPIRIVDGTPSAAALQRQQVWQTLSESAQAQFGWPSPGQPLSTPEPSPELTSAAARQPPPHFCLLLLTPEHVDYLQLRPQPHQRWVYNRTTHKGWVQRAVTP